MAATSTETLLHHQDNMAPAHRPYSRSKTTYGNMNAWTKGASDDVMPQQTCSTQRQSHRGDDYYQRYLQLSSNVAFRHPNPGVPRERTGRIGGTWRHIREVLGYTGSQVCFVDGLVSLYDTETMRNGMQRGPAWRARMAGPTGYSANFACDMDSGPQYELQSGSPDGGRYKGFYTLRK